MIASINGQIILKGDKFVIVQNKGIGYKINVSPENLTNLKMSDECVFFWTYQHVREDALELYGFLNREDLEFFELLIGIPGIGPKSAQAILGIASIDTLRKTIASGDTSYLTKISGIGRKTAEKIVIELRDKIGEEKLGTSMQEELDALEALKALGYSQNQARDALKKVVTDTDTNTKVREALKILGGK